MTHPWELPLSGPAAAIADATRAAVPVLTTERLNLRAPRVTDFDAYSEIFMSDRAVHMDGPYDREGAWADFTQATAGWMLRGIGMWTMERRSDGAVVGFGFFWQEFGDPEPEIGWALTAEAEGHGYATEAPGRCCPMRWRSSGRAAWSAISTPRTRPRSGSRNVSVPGAIPRSRPPSATLI